MSYGNWRNLAKEGDRKFYGFKDNPKRPDSENLTLQIETWPKWNPCNDMNPKATRRHVTPSKLRLIV